MSNTAKGRQLSDTEIGYALGAADFGVHQRSIAAKLKCSQNTISRVLNRFNISTFTTHPKCNGPAKNTSERDNRELKHLALKNRRSTLEDITNMSNLPVSRWTISRRLNEMGINSHVARQKPFLNDQHIADRLKWVQDHSNWTVEDWKRVVWSDECCIKVGLNPCRQRVWRHKREELNPECLIVKFKGGHIGIMVWACFSYDHLSRLVIFPKGGIGSEEYIMALEDTLLPFIKSLFPETNNGDTITVIDSNQYIFMQDNASCHTSKQSQRFFASKQIPVMDWPANSPDLNPLENLWSDFKARFHQHFTDTKSKPSSSKDAIDKYAADLQKVWEECSMDLVHSLVESMPQRVQAVLKAKGGHTKY